MDDNKSELTLDTIDDVLSYMKGDFLKPYPNLSQLDVSHQGLNLEPPTPRSLNNFDSDDSTLSPISQLLFLTRAKFYDFCPLDTNKNPFPFSQLKGKIVLIVNVASYCGFSYQYKGLEELSKKFANDPVVILGFPCNQFLFQEPFDNDRIVTTCKRRYDVSFPILDKVHVNGSQTDPVYQFLKESKTGICNTKVVKWNFEKFLIDHEGNVVERYSTFTSPAFIGGKIEEMLESMGSASE